MSCDNLKYIQGVYGDDNEVPMLQLNMLEYDNRCVVCRPTEYLYRHFFNIDDLS